VSIKSFSLRSLLCLELSARNFKPRRTRSNTEEEKFFAPKFRVLLNSLTPLSKNQTKKDKVFAQNIRVTPWFSLLLFSTLILVISSCTTTNIKYTPSIFTTIETIHPQWQTFANGIDYFHGKISSPALEFHALKIDLFAQELEIVVKGGANQENQTQSIKVSTFVRDNNLQAGINATPFDIVSSKEGRAIQNVGIVISNGKTIAPPNPTYDALIFYKDGKAAIVNQSTINTTENIANTVGGFHQILTGGTPAQRTQDKKAKHPRSVAGISQDGKYLYLAVIDGRRTASVGTSEEETALLLRSLGSWDALNLDGGGSTTLALRFADGKVKVVNTPIHGGIPHKERAVASCIGVR